MTQTQWSRVCEEWSYLVYKLRLRISYLRRLRRCRKEIYQHLKAITDLEELHLIKQATSEVYAQALTHSLRRSKRAKFGSRMPQDQRKD
jgi:hypothetical protein